MLRKTTAGTQIARVCRRVEQSFARPNVWQRRRLRIEHDDVGNDARPEHDERHQAEQPRELGIEIALAVPAIEHERAHRRQNDEHAEQNEAPVLVDDAKRRRNGNRLDAEQR